MNLRILAAIELGLFIPGGPMPTVLPAAPGMAAHRQKLRLFSFEHGEIGEA
jgi:hypothetical protein